MQSLVLGWEEQLSTTVGSAEMQDLRPHLRRTESVIRVHVSVG